jgi:peptide deformylase
MAPVARLKGKAKGDVEEVDEEVEREARRRYLLANVRQFPDPVLRTPANEVAAFDAALAALVERMMRVMQAGNGIGLAAPQVGVLQRVFVHQADEDADPVAIVNPRILASSDEKDVVEEGCLSLAAAAVTMDVERPLRVTIQAASATGEPLHIEAEGLVARCIQHEIDHLDGVLILDRATDEQRRAALAKLRPQPVLNPIA